MKRVCNLVCIHILFIAIPCIADYPLPPSQLLPGWQRVQIQNVGTIDIPLTMEVQGDALSNLSKEINKRLIQEDGSADSGRITIQQKGLNALDPEATKLYMRIMVKTTIGSPGDFKALNSRFAVTQEELKEMSLLFRTQAENQFMRILQWDAPSVELLNEMQAIRFSYRRQIKDNPPVRVVMYIIQNYDRMHHLTMSYRESERHLWLNDFSTILSSFRITNDRSPTVWIRGSVDSKDKEDWILNIIISAILTWSIGLAPPLLMRFVFLRRPARKSVSFAFVAVFWVINITIFIALGSQSRTHGALFLVALVSYYILRSGWRGYQPALKSSANIESSNQEEN